MAEDEGIAAEGAGRSEPRLERDELGPTAAASRGCEGTPFIVTCDGPLGSFSGNLSVSCALVGGFLGMSIGLLSCGLIPIAGLMFPGRETKDPGGPRTVAFCPTFGLGG